MAVAPPTPETRRPFVALTTGEVFWGGLSLLLVAGYVNTAIVWRWLEAGLPSAALAAIPLLLALSLAATLSFGRWRLAKLHPARVAGWVLVACLLAGAAWAMTDSRFPAKRVHIFEYALLALVARQFFRERLTDPMRTIAGSLVAGILGLHDELLQGLHPGRYFAPTDVAVNALSACAGGALAYAFHDSAGATPTRALRPRQWAVIGLSLIGLAGFIYYLAAVGAALPGVLGLGLPLLGLFAWLLLSRGDSIDEGGPRFVAVAMVLSAAAVAAPSIAILFDLPFA